jgi:hypothetical protein
VDVPDGVALYVSADDVVLAALAQSQLHFLCPRLKKKKKALIYVYVLARVSECVCVCKSAYAYGCVTLVIG